MQNMGTLGSIPYFKDVSTLKNVGAGRRSVVVLNAVLYVPSIGETALFVSIGSDVFR